MMRRLFWLLLLFWLFPALACNIPRAGQELQFPTPTPPVWVEPFFPTPEPLELPVLPEEIIPPPTDPLPMPPPEEPAPIPPTPQLVEGMILPPPALDGSQQFFYYTAQSGDTLQALAYRFDVETYEITSSTDLPAGALLLPGQALVIPNRLGPITYPQSVLPDSEIVFSPSTVGFDLEAYVHQAGGYLSTYTESVGGEWLTGAQIVRKVAVENSTNPRFLLAFLEHRSGWVFGQPYSPEKARYPIGFYVPGYQGLHKELSLTSKMLSTGYYGWRAGDFHTLQFPNNTPLRLAPGLNAGTVAVQYLFSKFYREGDWSAWLYTPGSFQALYWEMFGDAWERAAQVEPLLPAALLQPPLELPFNPGERWSFTGGPHASWLTGTPRGALDFAPVTGEPKCAVSRAWVTASAPGLVVRSEGNVVILDLDGDGNEQTGWTLLYMHIAHRDRIPVGAWVSTDDPIGHPSCEGGSSTGTHVHIARKYNGEWIAADGPLPFMLSGWRAVAHPRIYEGLLVNDGKVVSARPDGSSTSSIFR